MGDQVKLEKGIWSYDLEYRSHDDDAWYNVSVALDNRAQTLVVKHFCSPDEYEVILSAGGFETEAQVEELIGRFRPVSVQVQDHECGKLEIGAIVCAALCTGDGDLRFYDAVIEAEMDTAMTLESLAWKSGDSCSIRNYNEWSREDEDMGPQPQPCNVDHDLAIAEGQYFIVINNLEKDLNPSTIKKFIYKHTTILPQVFVFPRLLSDPFARGAVLVDCQQKVQIIYKFLDNPNYLIVSSRGRPWVVTEKASAGTFATSISNLIPMDQDEMQCGTNDGELEIVRSGTESYDRAKQLSDLLREYIHHEVQVSKRLIYEEKRIWQSFRSA